MIKLVASDLDGTLLLHKAQSLPEEIFSLIRQLEELGIMFVAASGRQYPNMTKLFAPVASEISYISENGALAVDHGEVLYQDSFDRKLAGEIISAILEKKDAEFTCSAKDYHYLMPKTKRFHDHMLYEVKNECRFVNSMEEMTAPIMKLAVFEPAGLTEESVKYWMDRFGKECVVSLREMSGSILFLLEQTRQKESENIRKDIIFRRKNVLRSETNIMI